MPGGDPVAEPDAGPRRHLTVPLCIGVAALLAGTGLHTLAAGPGFGSLLSGDVRWLGWVLIAAAPACLAPRLAPLGLLATAWVLLEVVAHAIAASPFYEVAPLASALRYTGPVALLLAWRGHGARCAQCLRFAAAATFVGHGVEALGQHPVFVEYIRAAGALIGLEVALPAIRDSLIAIGVADLLVAVVVLVRPVRAALLYMAIWGALTALARVVHAGADGIPACMLRALHALGPLAVYLHLRRGT